MSMLDFLVVVDDAWKYAHRMAIIIIIRRNRERALKSRAAPSAAQDKGGSGRLDDKAPLLAIYRNRNAIIPIISRGEYTDSLLLFNECVYILCTVHVFEYSCPTSYAGMLSAWLSVYTPILEASSLRNRLVCS